MSIDDGSAWKRISFVSRNLGEKCSVQRLWRIAWPGEKRGNLETRRLLPTGLAHFGNRAA